jgi:hypothetical protein
MGCDTLHRLRRGDGRIEHPTQQDTRFGCRAHLSPHLVLRQPLLGLCDIAATPHSGFDLTPCQLARPEGLRNVGGASSYSKLF